MSEIGAGGSQLPEQSEIPRAGRD